MFSSGLWPSFDPPEAGPIRGILTLSNMMFAIASGGLDTAETGILNLSPSQFATLVSPAANCV
jgi:hypothetical protein